MSKIAFTPNASGTGTFSIASPGTNTDRTLTLPDATGTVVLADATQTLTNKTISGPTISGATITGSTIQGGAITRGTAVSASGTFIDFTGIPSWAKRVTVMMSGVSTNGTASRIIRIGGSGGIESSGYLSAAWTAASAGTFVNTTIGFILTFTGTSAAAGTLNGLFVLTNISDNTWVASGSFYDPNYGAGVASAGSKTISTTLDRVRITTAIETDLFDAGTINVLWEG
jgi:hypothetical protein